MKKQLFHLILLCILLIIGKLAAGQAVNFYYELKPGTNDRDTVIVYALSNSNSSVLVNAVNFSFAFQSSCSATVPLSVCSTVDTLIEVNYSWFTPNWSSFAFIEKCNISNPVGITWNGTAYNHRFSYGHANLNTPWNVPPSNSPDKMEIMKLVIDKVCVGDVYMENKLENPVNTLGDATFNELSFQIFRFGSAFPVDFASFEAEKTNNNHVRLHWVTQKELNSDYFQVQKSFTGRFDSPLKLGNVTAAGVSDEMKSYEFWDTSPVARQVFYRLKHVDKDGLVQYSPTVQLNFDKGGYTMYAVSDPIDKNLTIKLFSNDDQSYQLSLLDLHGQTIKKDQYRFGPASGDQLQWEISDLPAGMYLLQVIDNTFNQKTIKVYIH